MFTDIFLQNPSDIRPSIAGECLCADAAEDGLVFGMERGHFADHSKGIVSRQWIHFATIETE